MIQFDQWWLPDGETHLQHWMTQMQQKRDGRLCYQMHKYDAAIKHCRQRRTAVDVGAHVGLLSWLMAKDFDQVVAFEPHQDHAECWVENMRGIENAVLHQNAIGDRTGFVSLTTGPSSSGDTYVTPGGEVGTINMFPLDSFKMLDGLDFLKIDTEGHEVFVLRGAEQTIRRWQPVIMVEQKPTHGRKYNVDDRAALPFLQSLGYTLRQEINGDLILTKG